MQNYFLACSNTTNSNGITILPLGFSGNGLSPLPTRPKILLNLWFGATGRSRSQLSACWPRSRPLQGLYTFWLFCFALLTKYLKRSCGVFPTRLTRLDSQAACGLRLLQKINPVWCHRQESNLHQGLRSPLFYPLNYGGV